MPDTSDMKDTNTLQDTWSPATLALHGDDEVDTYQDGAPALHFATTFKYPNDHDRLVPIPYRDSSTADPLDFYYSRIAAPTTERYEAVLSKVLKGDAVTYPSGLSAFHAALVLLNPKKISTRDDFYFGCQGVIDTVARMSGLQRLPLDCTAEELGAGDLIVLETPLSPSGFAFNITHYAEKAHSQGAFLLVSGTLAPPGLQDPFARGADLVMHAGSKYIAGHADMLCGILATTRKEWTTQLRRDRSILGNVLGAFESWLGMRSLRTLPLRIQRQSESTGRLVSWLVDTLAEKGEDSLILSSSIEAVGHTSLQKADFEWLLLQMPSGFGPVFSITMKSEEMARTLPSKLRLFKHQTSFGGVESAVEWRKMSDTSTDSRLLRFSIGLEEWEDLRDDLLSGMRQVVT